MEAPNWFFHNWSVYLSGHDGITVRTQFLGEAGTMVPLFCLLALVPMAFAGMSMEDMMNMQHMMQMMEQHKGWGGWGNGNGNGNGMGGGMHGGMQGNNQGGQWWNMMSAEDAEAYKKWCEERQRTEAEHKQQKELLEMWEKQEEARKMEAEKKRHEREAAERHESMMAQWKMWQMKISQQHEFEDMTYKFMEQKHAYMYMVTTQFLQFCKCSDFTEELGRYFVHDGVDWENHDDFDLDELEAIDTNDAVAVARALVEIPPICFDQRLWDEECRGKLEAEERFERPISSDIWP
ncbi:hypothetical protein PoB_002295600 [Plakobranchus ocellatus]|uniref:Uncharacterized protein n=1 Tax=Plakobranchus ocellatus TaxID=259542 RepID=A0AAV3ZKI3_9GAST|nr:hypothetical protein PoB_002295600 [Plakobranchus ocellatus]